MEARFILRPLASAARPKQYLEPIDITDEIIRPPRIVARVERDDWSWGKIAFGDIRLTVRDRGRLYSGPTATASIFNYATKNGVELTIEYPTTRGGDKYTTIWRGEVTGKAGNTRPQSGRSEIYARSKEVQLKEGVIAVNEISDGDIMLSALKAIFQKPTLLAEVGPLAIEESDGVYIGDPINGGTIIRNAGRLYGREYRSFSAEGEEVQFFTAPRDIEIEDMVENILQLWDSTISYIPSANNEAGGMEIRPRGGGAVIGPTLTEIINVETEAYGGEQVLNNILINSGLTRDQRIVQSFSPTSAQVYGERRKKINLRWIQNEQDARAIGLNLVTRLANPRHRLRFTISPWALGSPSEIVAGRRINVDIKAIAEGGFVHGSGTTPSGRYVRARHSIYAGEYWIEEVEWQPYQDMVVVQLRAVGNPVVKAPPRDEPLPPSPVPIETGSGRDREEPEDGGEGLGPGDIDGALIAPGAIGPRIISPSEIWDGKWFPGQIDRDGKPLPETLPIDDDKFEPETIEPVKIIPNTIPDRKLNVIIRPARLIRAGYIVGYSEFTGIPVPAADEPRDWYVYAERIEAVEGEAGPPYRRVANLGLYYMGAFRAPRDLPRWFDRRDNTRRDMGGNIATTPEPIPEERPGGSIFDTGVDPFAIAMLRYWPGITTDPGLDGPDPNAQAYVLFQNTLFLEPFASTIAEEQIRINPLIEIYDAGPPTRTQPPLPKPAIPPSN